MAKPKLLVRQTRCAVDQRGAVVVEKGHERRAFVGAQGERREHLMLHCSTLRRGVVGFGRVSGVTKGLDELVHRWAIIW